MQVISEGIKSLKSRLYEKTFAPSSDGPRKATVISICSQKGGVGKTTTAVNVGFILSALHGKKTLILDLDPQGHVESSLHAIIPDGQRYRPLSGLLTDKKPDFMEGIVKTELDGFDISPGDKTLIETESLITTKIGKEFLLKEAIFSLTNHYDFILIDCPPNLGNLTLNSLVASQYCLVPCEMATLSLEGVSDIFETIETINERLNRKLKVLGILLTRVDTRNTTLNQTIHSQLAEHAQNHLFETQITINTDLPKAQSAGKPVLTFASSSKGARNYRQLTQEILARIPERIGATHPESIATA
jgi:chromosome partitioning protein